MSSTEDINKQKSILRAMLKTCYSPESTVELMYKYAEDMGNDRYLEGVIDGIERMAAAAQDAIESVPLSPEDTFISIGKRYESLLNKK